ncbi:MULTISPECIES: hypothetical protein [unclassified Janthinobacterium]|uniref:hypothetical protein n=1 Tax=unclassified Janthinobacterium TaxID=2610881 RepID=UPI001613C26C|nr:MULTISPECIES: hypothetical protein [unclassified Janthinobacterium]MBB5609597.1 hypothetical protein [Janthinobacterium sp. S3T4]MBB5614769.1 hypothetical protein [Janthinobacterium sp. S3M3]
MAHTLAAVFDNREAAEKARQKLISSGYASDNIRLNDSSSDYSGAASASAIDTSRDDDGFVASIKHFFTDMFGSHEDRHVYAEAVARGNVVLTLTSASDADIDRASDIVEDFGPINIDEHGEQWRTGGNLSGSLGGGMASGASLQSSSSSLSGSLSQPPLGATPQEGNLSGASQQFARDDSSASGIPRSSNVRSYPRADNLPGSNDDDEQYYRNHWDVSYGATGARFEDYDPAYRYGHSMAGSDSYRGRPWDEVEPELRSTWEHTYPQSTWENFKAAVRHGWERVTS